MNKEILKLAIPNIISNLSIPLLSVVDIALMGHLDGAYYILAVGFGTTIFNFIYWGFGFLRMGTTGFTAQAYGSKHLKDASHYFYRGIFIALTGGALLILFQTFLLKLGLLFFDTNPDVERALISYYNVRIFAAPATLSLYVFIGWFLGMQNAKIPMVLTVAINLTNIAANYYFVRIAGMHADGVALGTVIAQYVGVTLGIVLLLYYYPSIKSHVEFPQIFNWQKVKNFLSVNADIVIRTLCLIFAIGLFKMASGQLGEIPGAANIVLLEFFTLAAYGIDGFAFAAESISGKYLGAKSIEKLNQAIRNLFIWGIGIAFICTIVFWFGGQNIIELMTNQQAVVEEAILYLPWMIVAPIIMAVAFIWDGVYIGMTASKAMRNTMLIATVFFYLPTVWLLPKFWDNHGLWLAFIIFLAARGIGQTILFKRLILKYK